MTSVVLSHPHNGKEVGAKLELDDGEARRLVRAGVALYATVTEAKRVGASPDEAATKRS